MIELRQLWPKIVSGKGISTHISRLHLPWVTAFFFAHARVCVTVQVSGRVVVFRGMSAWRLRSSLARFTSHSGTLAEGKMLSLHHWPHHRVTHHMSAGVVAVVWKWKKLNKNTYSRNTFACIDYYIRKSKLCCCGSGLVWPQGGAVDFLSDEHAGSLTWMQPTDNSCFPFLFPWSRFTNSNANSNRVPKFTLINSLFGDLRQLTAGKTQRCAGEGLSNEAGQH